MVVITKFNFGSETNLSTPIAYSNIPLKIINKIDGFFDDSTFITVVQHFSNEYQRATLKAYKHPRLGIVLWFYGEHETGMWSYLLKPIIEEIPEIRLESR